MIYKCRECGETFDEIFAEYYDPVPGDIEDCDYEDAIVCPYCDSLDVIAMMQTD